MFVYVQKRYKDCVIYKTKADIPMGLSAVKKKVIEHEKEINGEIPDKNELYTIGLEYVKTELAKQSKNIDLIKYEREFDTFWDYYSDTDWTYMKAGRVKTPIKRANVKLKQWMVGKISRMINWQNKAVNKVYSSNVY